jgi:tRNA nucleotidyltransferase (CCA-adding enzyme)
VQKILDRLKGIFPRDTRSRVFLVGGAVRDILTGRQNTDIDLTASLTPDEYTSLGFHLVEGRSTAPIRYRQIEGLGTVEVTLLNDAEELSVDLRRRDFTINAMAITLEGDIIDPLGAREDLEQRLLSPCSRYTFSDDPLRVFRAFRFAADDWHMTHECEKLLRGSDLAGRLSHIPIERFSREMLKALECTDPGRFFLLMLDYGIGQTYLPDIFRMRHIPAGPLEHHPEGDLFTHSLQVLQRVAAVTDDPLARFCAFFHDIGKLATPPSLYPRHHGHDQAGFRMAQQFCHGLRLPAHFGKTLSWVSRLHGTFNLWDNLRDSTRIKLAGQAIKAGITGILPLVAAADKEGGSEPQEWRAAVDIAGRSARELGIDLQQLESMRTAARADYVLQTQVERLRSTRTAST